MKTALAQVIVYVFVWSNLSVQCFVAYDVHCYTLLYTRMHCYLHIRACSNSLPHISARFSVRTGPSPTAPTYSVVLFSNGTGFGPRNGGGQKCTKLNGT